MRTMSEALAARKVWDLSHLLNASSTTLDRSSTRYCRSEHSRIRRNFSTTMTSNLRKWIPSSSLQPIRLITKSKTLIQILSSWIQLGLTQTTPLQMSTHLHQFFFRRSPVRRETPTHHVMVTSRTRSPTAHLRPVLIRKMISELTAKTKKMKKQIPIKKTWSMRLTRSRAMEESAKQSATRARSSSLRMRSTWTKWSGTTRIRTSEFWSLKSNLTV